MLELVSSAGRLLNATCPVTRWDPGFSAWPFPFRSPLLGESRLCFVPPLNDMLKFGGYSRSIPGRNYRSTIRDFDSVQSFSRSHRVNVGVESVYGDRCIPVST